MPGTPTERNTSWRTVDAPLCPHNSRVIFSLSPPAGTAAKGAEPSIHRSRAKQPRSSVEHGAKGVSCAIPFGPHIAPGSGGRVGGGGRGVHISTAKSHRRRRSAGHLAPSPRPAATAARTWKPGCCPGRTQPAASGGQGSCGGIDASAARGRCYYLGRRFAGSGRAAGRDSHGQLARPGFRGA